MSNSIFIPKSVENGSFKEMFSATSSVPDVYKSGNAPNSDANKIMNDISALINGANLGQAGGAKKAKRGSRKSSKEQPKMVAKKGSRKGSKRGRKSSKRDDQSGGKRRGSKKGSKRGSKSSRLSGGDSSDDQPKKKKGINEFMKKLLAVKATLKKDDTSVKDGPPLTKLVSNLLKENDLSVSATIASAKKLMSSGKFSKQLDDIKEEILKKRQDKKNKA
jgi:hypothetical protein